MQWLKFDSSGKKQRHVNSQKILHRIKIVAVDTIQIWGVGTDRLEGKSIMVLLQDW